MHVTCIAKMQCLSSITWPDTFSILSDTLLHAICNLHYWMCCRHWYMWESIMNQMNRIRFLFPNHPTIWGNDNIHRYIVILFLNIVNTYNNANITHACILNANIFLLMIIYTLWASTLSTNIIEMNKRCNSADRIWYMSPQNVALVKMSIINAWGRPGL